MQYAISVLFFIFVFSQYLIAAPDIKSISGNTINLSEAGIKSEAAPKVWAKFESNLTESGVLILDPDYGPGQWALSQTGNRTTGNFAYRFFSHDQRGALKYTQGSDTTGIYYINFWMKLFTDSAGGKPLRLYWGNGASNTYIAAGKSLANEEGTVNGYSEVDTEHGSKYSSPAIIPDGIWHNYEIIMNEQLSPSGTVYVYVDNVLSIASTDGAWWSGGVYLPEGHTIDLGHMVTGNGGTGYLSPNNKGYCFDDYYVDYAQARVMIGNNSTFASCTHREIQIPTSWSDTSIAITVNQGSFSDGELVYLFVIDSDGNASEGYPVIISGGQLSHPSIQANNLTANNVTFGG